MRTYDRINTLRLLTSTLILLVFLFPSILVAEVTVTASVDRTEITENENVDFTIEIKGDVSQFPDLELPELPGFKTYSSGTSQNFSFVNGRTEQSKQFHFSLVPLMTGKLAIPPMSVTVDGKKYATGGFDILVKKASSRTRTNRQQQPQHQRSTRGQQGVSSEDLFIRTSVDKDTVYVNEQITLSFKFFQGVNILKNPDYKPPQKTGFWVEDLPPQKKSYKTIKGREYATTEIRTALFPTAPGEHTVGSAQLDVVVQQRRRDDPFSMFDNWSGLFGRGQTVSLKSDPIEIVTLPLPAEGKPRDFSGAVGSYRITATVDHTSVEVNEPVTMTIKISGIGNIKTVATPTIQELPDFRIYQSGDTENVTKANYRIGGSKMFEHVFVPKRAGNYLLPAISFSYFDPAAREYKAVTTKAIQLEVTPAKDRYVSQMQNMEANKIDLVAKDIRYLKSELGDIANGGSVLYALRPVYLLIYLLPMIGYLAVIGHQRRKEKLESNVSFKRLKLARKMAEQRLAKAKKYLTANDADLFYSETSRSLNEYFADRFNLPAHGLTADKIRDYSVGNLSEPEIDRLLDILRQCDYGRFAPGGSEVSRMEQLWNDAARLIVELEKTK